MPLVPKRREVAIADIAQFPVGPDATWRSEPLPLHECPAIPQYECWFLLEYDRLNQNPNQGRFIIEELTDLVEQAVLAEFDRLSECGGVLGAMETGYQRGKIQDESMLYEHRKHGSLPIMGVNTFLNPQAEAPFEIELVRSRNAEKQQ